MVHHYPTLDEITHQYFVDRPEEVGDFVRLLLEEYEEDQDAAALVSALRAVFYPAGAGAAGPSKRPSERRQMQLWPDQDEGEAGPMA